MTVPGAAPAPPSALVPDDTPTPIVAGGRPRWALFALLAVAVVAIDQLAKGWVAASQRRARRELVRVHWVWHPQHSAGC